MIKLSNNLEEIYSGEVTKALNGGWLCPVCQKTFKTETGAKKHFEKKGCHTLKQLFMGTEFESCMYTFYKELLAVRGNRGFTSLSTFREGSLYKPVARFLSFCIENGVDVYKYMFWLVGRFGSDTPLVQLLGMGRKDETLRKYRAFLRTNPGMIDSHVFFEKHREQLQTDLSFLIRAVQRADVDLGFVIRRIDTDKLLASATDVEILRFDALLDALDRESMEAKLL